MRRFSKKIAAALSVFILTAALGACGGGKTQEETSSPTALPEPVEGGEITVAIAQDLDDSLDPHKMVSAGTREVLFNVFEGLLKPASDGSLIPAVASSYDVSETGDAFTFTLREGVRFHNGEPVTAGDVVFSLRRCAGEDGGAPLISAFSSVESVEELDSRTVKVTLKEPNIEFLSYLTAAIIPRAYDGQATAPIGTGPFKFISRAPQENIILERFGDYWGEDAYLDKVTVKIIDNPETLIMALKAGSVDLCMRLTYAQTTELPGGEYAVYFGSMNLVQAVYLNNAAAPLDDPEVRRALSYAIGRDQIAEFISPGASFPVGSSMYPGFEKYFAAELADYYNYDPEKAKELLAKAGYPEGFSLEITVPSNHGPHVDTAQIVAEQLRAAGVTATIRLVEWASWLSDVYQGRDFEATIIGVDASALTARAMLERFVSDDPGNFINFNSPEYDEVFAKAAAAVNEKEQIALYKRLQEILTEEAANLYIQDMVNYTAAKKNIVGLEFYPLYVLDLQPLQKLDA